jgi:hypothetical protein
MPHTKNISVGYICKPGACLFTLFCQEIDLIILARSQEGETYAVPNWPPYILSFFCQSLYIPLLNLNSFMQVRCLTGTSTLHKILPQIASNQQWVQLVFSDNYLI